MLFVLAVLSASIPMGSRLADGNTLYLSYVSDSPYKRSWRPGGELQGPCLSAKASAPFHGLNVSPQSGDLLLLFTLRLQHTPGDLVDPVGSRWMWQPAMGQADPSAGKKYATWSAQPLEKGYFSCVRYVHKPTGDKPLSFSVSVADGAWETVDRARFRKGRKVAGGAFISSATIPPEWSKTPMKDAVLGFPVSVPPHWKSDDVRLVGFDGHGKVEMGGGIAKLAPGRSYQWFACPSDQVARVELQVRPYLVAHFSGVLASPAAK